MDSGIGLNTIHIDERMVQDGPVMQFQADIFQPTMPLACGQETTDLESACRSSSSSDAETRMTEPRGSSTEAGSNIERCPQRLKISEAETG